jgi:hypothetical protein
MTRLALTTASACVLALALAPTAGAGGPCRTGQETSGCNLPAGAIYGARVGQVQVLFNVNRAAPPISVNLRGRVTCDQGGTANVPTIRPARGSTTTGSRRVGTSFRVSYRERLGSNSQGEIAQTLAGPGRIVSGRRVTVNVVYTHTQGGTTDCSRRIIATLTRAR